MDKNIENNIKHHFENRRINPDQKAWSKLDGLLAQSEKENLISIAWLSKHLLR